MVNIKFCPREEAIFHSLPGEEWIEGILLNLNNINNRFTASTILWGILCCILLTNQCLNLLYVPCSYLTFDWLTTFLRMLILNFGSLIIRNYIILKWNIIKVKLVKLASNYFKKNNHSISIYNKKYVFDFYS